MKQGIFVTGTGTDVGKTYITALLLKGLREKGIDAGYFKAALSGAEWRGGKRIPGDAEFVCKIAGIPDPPESLVPYCYDTAVSPHLAAKLEGNPIELEQIAEALERVQNRFPFVAAEGSGGILCPLRYDEKKLMLTDVIRLTGFELLLVAPAGLGTINSAILTIDYAKGQGFRTAGVILNQYEPRNFLHEDNRKMIEELSGIPVIAYAEKGADHLVWFQEMF